jgi:hypothetical protein
MLNDRREDIEEIKKAVLLVLLSLILFLAIVFILSTDNEEFKVLYDSHPHWFFGIIAILSIAFVTVMVIHARHNIKISRSKKRQFPNQ